jgi:hypothetical protein
MSYVLDGDDPLGELRVFESSPVMSNEYLIMLRDLATRK